MTKFNIGDKVVPISKSVCGSLGSSNVWLRAQEKKQGFIYVNSYETNGDVTCSDELDYNSGDFFTESDLVLYSENTVNLINTQKLIDTLETVVGEANVAIKTLKGYQVKETSPEPVVETTNTRQEIVGEAKAFVEKYGAVRNSNGSHNVGNVTAQEHYYEAEFVTKGNKITALIYHLNFGKTRRSNKPERIGRAKCAPDNVSNKHIGEAIALGRALDINVDKFINAVQPTEIFKGTVIHYVSDYGATFTHTSNGGEDTKTNNRDLNNKTGKGWSCTIKDDTNAQYEGTK